ncbi:MATE family efflux transporter [Clostridium tagluense]|uniref:MATE family efflux transporter n=1 Tax=Clostridium tagluense TaxID=360422 RepID=UPI001C0C7B93|nr:MATE family efflux transporter [Clostridium tagluense]MBU3129130.1 MATE family efflux transporter [Clostridium tagluense]MBW9156208.1 MATE family efflux transporter [Clostridium tagluense]WLC65554.1 MATE family efflux transporter [Clostridium tagluense]
MDKSKQLGEESIGKLLMKFSIPAIVGMLVNALYNVVDRVFIGHIGGGIGKIALTGVTVTFPISTIIMAFGMLVGIGTAALISIKLGQQKKEEAEHILGNALTLIIITSLIVTAVGLIFLEPMLLKFGASSETLPYAKEYITVILIGVIFQNVGFGLNNTIRSEGNPRIAMFTMLIGGILNTILDPIFIFVFHMGTRGAAIATVISQAANTIWVLYYFFGGSSVLKIRYKNLKLDFKVVKGIFAIGMSPFFMQIAASVVTIISNKSLFKYGDDYAIGAMGIITSIVMMVLMPIFGINQGSQPIIGYNYGAKKYNRVKKALKLAILSATIITTSGYIIIQLFPKQLISIFNNDPELIGIGIHGIRIYLFMLPIIGFQIVSSNYFQAIGKAKISIFLGLSRQVIILIPLLFILPRYYELNGVWMSGPISDALASILTAIFLFVEIKHLNRLHGEDNEVAI